ncbi:MAG: hypothetical protein IIC46_00550 [Planctomycetes bacterium]|nr:hypothetical protein [Planctomycetota bacterium]
MLHPDAAGRGYNWAGGFNVPGAFGVDGVVDALPTLSSIDLDRGYAVDINASRHIVGYSRNADLQDRPTLWREVHANEWTASEMMVLDGYSSGQAQGMNEASDAVGYSFDSALGRQPTVWLADEAWQPYGLPALEGGGAAEARDINAARQVVGWADTADGKRHAVLWEYDGQSWTIRDLMADDSIGESRAVKLNDAGEIVGRHWVDGNIHHSDAWYWTVDGNSVNLEAHRCSFRRGGAEGWTLIAARDIAEDGTICGHGTAPGEEPWSAWVLRLDTCVGNVDGADCVDFEDLIYLLNHWGPECSPSRVQSR